MSHNGKVFRSLFQHGNSFAEGEFWFNKYIGVGADIRYDKVFDNVTTRYSDLDLDTWNTDLKFLFRF